MVTRRQHDLHKTLDSQEGRVACPEEGQAVVQLDVHGQVVPQVVQRSTEQSVFGDISSLQDITLATETKTELNQKVN